MQTFYAFGKIMLCPSFLNKTHYLYLLFSKKRKPLKYLKSVGVLEEIYQFMVNDSRYSCKTRCTCTTLYSFSSGELDIACLFEELTLTYVKDELPRPFIYL